MKHRLCCWMTALALPWGAACAQPDAPAEPGPTYRPTSTIKDIMDSVVDPSADEIWESVATVIDADGVHELHPETDEDWAAIRRSAIRLVEASNLLLIPGRDVADAGHSSEYPGIELEPEEIQALIDGDQVQWMNLAYDLHDVASTVVSAIDTRDVDALMDAGAELDQACEQCHLQYWYPNDGAYQELFNGMPRLVEEEPGGTP